MTSSRRCSPMVSARGDGMASRSLPRAARSRLLAAHRSTRLECRVIELYEAFKAHLAPGVDPAGDAEDRVARYVEAARNAWPDLDIDPVDFVRALAARAPDGEPPPIAHAADLYLAF